mgnify:CR=1 FL=1
MEVEQVTAAAPTVAQLLQDCPRLEILVIQQLRPTTPEGHHAFDSVYPALGSDTHTELGEQLGVAITADTGCITVDSHQRTSVAGIYAAGDVVIGLDQISHAMGEGGVAATTIRNDLAKEQPLRREPAD